MNKLNLINIILKKKKKKMFIDDISVGVITPNTPPHTHTLTGYDSAAQDPRG